MTKIALVSVYRCSGCPFVSDETKDEYNKYSCSILYKIVNPSTIDEECPLDNEEDENE